MAHYTIGDTIIGLHEVLTHFFYIAVDSYIISVIASIPTHRELYGLDRAMNFYRSRDSGKSWVQVDERRFREIQQKTNVTLASGISESIVSDVPLANYTAVASSGLTWGG